jgi:hypothetical protein
VHSQNFFKILAGHVPLLLGPRRPRYLTLLGIKEKIYQIQLSKEIQSKEDTIIILTQMKTELGVRV